MDTAPHTTLVELSQAAWAATGKAALLRLGVTLVADRLAVAYSAVWELIPERGALVLQADLGGGAAGRAQETVGADLMSLADPALSSTALLIVSDWSRETRFPQPRILRERAVLSSLCVVIPGAPHPFGILTADSTAPRTFAEQEIHFLQTIANVLALAIDRMQINPTLEQRVVERTREIDRRCRVAESLHEILTILNSNQSLDDILDHIIAQACRLLGSTAGAIYRLRRKDALLQVRAACGPDLQQAGLALPVDGSATGQAVRTGRPVKIAHAGDEAADPGDRALASHAEGLPGGLLARYPALLAVPLVVKAEVYGAITFYYDEPRMCSDEEVRLAVVLSDQAALAIENARLVAASQQQAVLEERQRLARDLHDSVTQTIYSMALQAQAATRRLALGDVPTTAVYLQELQDAAREALEEMRLLIFQLRLPVLEQAGLPLALQARLAAMEGRSHLETRLIVEGVDRLPAPVEHVLYRIAQEALNNTLKHAHAQSISVALRHVQSRVILEITDDGVGFDTARAGESGGLGLRGIAERVAPLGGQLMLQSTPGAGTKLRVEITL